MKVVLLAFLSAVTALLAVYFIYSAQQMIVTVPNLDGGEVANLQLLQVQANGFVVGIGLAVVSAVCGIGSAIVAAIEAKRPSD